MKNLDYIEKQLILYCKGWFGDKNYERDLKYFAAEMYGIKPKHVDIDSIFNMVTDLFKKLREAGYIKINIKRFLAISFNSYILTQNRNKLMLFDFFKKILSLIDVMPVESENLERLELGKPDFTIVKYKNKKEFV